MPKADRANPKEKDTPSFEGPRHSRNLLAALLCLALAVLISYWLFYYLPAESSVHTSGGSSEVVKGKMEQREFVPNGIKRLGIIGDLYSAGSVWLLGAAGWLIPAFLFWMTYIYMLRARHLTATRSVALIIAVVTGASLLDMQSTLFTDLDYYQEGPGGALGKVFYRDIFGALLGPFGSGLVLGSVYLASMLFIFTRDIGMEFERLLLALSEWRNKRAALKAAIAEERRKQREEAAKARQAEAAAAATVAAPAINAGTSKKMVVPKTEDPLAEKPKFIPAAAVKPAPEPEKPAKTVTTPPQPAPAKAAASKTATDPKDLAVATGKLELNIVKPEETKKAKVTLPQSDDKDYEFPPLKLLREQVKTEGNSEEEHRQNAENLLRILGEFGVEVTLGEIHVGPVITRYEVVPAAGVRVEKISGLDKNIALGMRAQSVRILAPIPGKAAVGVEVPNQKPTPVGMREILESEDWVGAKAEIPIALGKDVSGKPLVSDLTKMPHLLIAGATGSGKSVCINSIVASILYSKSPKDLRLIMVDPKVVELKIFNTLPHMLIPVVTEPKKVPGALKWLLSEMEQRYQIFAKVNVRNITGFNNRKKDPKAAEFPPTEQQAELEGVAEEIEIPDRLPYIVAIIDELADLMMVNPAEIETSIARLAQLARAAGIHLIIATQRPSVNVITGVIKANLPSRIAFQVASQVDSRTILDTKGADTLIGRGDMLFSPPGSSRLVRAQGAFVADDEVIELVEFLKRNGPPQYAQSVQQQIDRAAKEDDDEDGEGGSDDLGDDQELFMQAFDVIKASRRASTSTLQRKLRIGYNRAARIMDLMEDKGIVGPENGSSPREILVDLDTYQP
ncbi:DNA translocase FtsK [Oleiharenicola lentus]|uniref:DNA translocase FtsK n=1 Tax=Oleiharenicola lentus TaxID=2508720 RepID=A0A4Q1C4H2_9BACT|nr:DNA translocase FtsK [Oleiharenicola lentus]RXK53183.1 DNA translocase FtsK [Oleiharenicola lentus]